MRKTAILALAAVSSLLVEAADGFANGIKITLVGPMTGTMAAIGDQLKAGAEAAVRVVNESGGVGGRQIELAIEDDACDPKQAVSVAQRIASMGVKFVVGHACSSASIPASAVYAEEDILMMSPASSSPDLTDNAFRKGWRTIMRLYPRDDAQGVVAANWISGKYRDNVAILNDKSAYGVGLAQIVRDTLTKAGTRVVLYDSITAGEKDYLAMVSKLKQLNPSIVFFGGYHTEAGLMARQAAEAGYKLPLFMGDTLTTPEFWQIAGTAGEGAKFVFSSDPQARPEAKEAVEKFKASGVVPEGFTLFSYAAVQAIAAGIERAGADNPAEVAKALKSGSPIGTVVGAIVFDDKGDIKDPSFDINVWHDGNYARLQE